MQPNPLKAYREANNLSQQEVADKLGISRQMVGFLESGEREFTADMAVKLEKEFGIPRESTRGDLFDRRGAERAA